MIECNPILIKDPWNTQDFIDFCARQLEQSARVLLNKLATYPAYKHISWKSLGGFKSARQRRFVMANIRKGVIKVPRKRTGTLGRSWSLRAAHTRARLAYIIGSNAAIAPYNRWVQDDERQAERFKRIGWPTPAEIARKYWPAEAKRIQQAAAHYRPRQGG